MPSLDSLYRDTLQALRALRREKTFSLTVVVTIGLCLGANLAIFAIVNGVLLKPLPFSDPQQLVTVYNQYPKAGVPHAGTSVPQYLERREKVQAFAEAAAIRSYGTTIGEAGSPERIAASFVTPSFFRVLRAAPSLGRTFADEEGFYGKHQVIILSDGLWRQRFGADPAVVGKTLRVDLAPYTIIGVMPRGFQYLDDRPQAWIPLCFSDDDRKADNRHNNNMSMIARLKPGAGMAEALSQIQNLNQRGEENDPLAKMVADAGFSTTVRDLHEDYVAQLRPTLLLLQAGVFVLLLIGAVNVANLLLVRASARLKDYSIRQALGASRRQLARHLLVEIVLLCLVGAAAGLGFGYGMLRAVALLGAAQLPGGMVPELDFTVCAIAVAAALLVGISLGSLIVWHTLRANLASMLSVEARGGTTSRSVHRVRHTLIGAQIALAFVLLTGTGLLGLSFRKLSTMNPGFRPDHVLTSQVALPWGNYKELSQRTAFTARLLTELRAAPGVSYAAVTGSLPFTSNNNNNATVVEGHTPAPGDSVRAHFMIGIDGDYFPAMGIPLREGRFLSEDDGKKDAAKVCVVDEAVAKRYWPNGSALGHRLAPVNPENQIYYTIVGVVGTCKQNDLAASEDAGAVYFPYSEQPSFSISMVVRTVQSPESVASQLRSIVLRIDPELPLSDTRAMTERLDASLDGRRTPLLLAAIFAGVALVLASVGIYGVLAYAVTQRRREIGIRMAVGAIPQQIRAQFLGLGGRLLAAGLAVGCIGAYFAARAMHSLLFGVTAGNTLVYASAALLLSVVALAACWLPSHRAASVPPLEALRDA
ncbi:hypothetical protein DB347_12405 [Opitutaceae bacterium EW11]|nr:hypothetical protein DB347_12405 [Opitutaceae bacterium EW11]